LIEDLIDTLTNKEIFTLLDLKSAFHQIEVHEDSVKYTSFVTPMGQFEYIKMPFGLRNAPATFQRFVNRVFDDMIRAGKVAIYLDDIMIASKSVEEHLITLTEVFQRLIRNKLELRIDKCRFMEEQCEYLGYIVSKKGIQPDNKNIEAIKNFPIPKNAKEVHSFLGLCSYFRKFIKEFSIKAKPLYNIIKKDAKFEFGEDKIQCFENLKNMLINAPILSIYDPKHEIEQY